jgi:hypothetical protein
VRDEVPLGGNLNDAVRVGHTVRRRAGPWTPAVHALLNFLEREDFEAPRVLGMDEQGREILEYIEGEAHAGNPAPLPDEVFREEHMIGAAEHLRRYHNLVAEFAAPPDAKYVLTLDWDLAGPGPRIWDVANAAYCWVPLIAGATAVPGIKERARRLRVFCESYGFEDRSTLLGAIRDRIIYVGEFIENQARSGDPGFSKIAARGTPRRMFEDDVGYLDKHRAVLQRALD